MCGRFVLDLPDDDVIELVEAIPANDLPDTPNYNICPTDSVHTVTSEMGVRRLRPMRWGFLPHWYKTPGDGPLLINARAESLAEKPAFRAACRQRRCLILATGFYEWTKDDGGNRLPWYIHPLEGGPVAFGGVWQDWERDGETLTTCAIVTTAANRTLSGLHHRMPLTLAPTDWALWLGEAGHGAARLMRPAPDELFAFHRVAAEVNSNRAAGRGLTDPLAA